MMSAAILASFGYHLLLPFDDHNQLDDYAAAYASLHQVISV
jgi:hypothetical protein